MEDFLLKDSTIRSRILYIKKVLKTVKDSNGNVKASAFL